MNRWVVLPVLVCLGILVGIAGPTNGGPSRITSAQVRAVGQAIEDEIYDRGLQKHSYMVGPEIRPGVTQLPYYVRPTLKGGEGGVIYKLMPYGEVIRGFYFKPNGLAVLDGDPDSGFPPTDPDMLTLYLDDDQVCNWKHTWLRLHFEVIDNPSAERSSQAAMRQKERVGYSYREMPRKEQRMVPPR